MQAPAQASYNGARPKQPAPARDVIEMKALRGGNAKYKKRQPYLIKSNSDAADARGDPVKVYVRSSGWTSLSDIQKVQNWTTPMYNSPVVRKNRAGPKSVKTEISFNMFCLALANQYQKHILILLQLKMS